MTQDEELRQLLRGDAPRPARPPPPLPPAAAAGSHERRSTDPTLQLHQPPARPTQEIQAPPTLAALLRAQLPGGTGAQLEQLAATAVALARIKRDMHAVWRERRELQQRLVMAGSTLEQEAERGAGLAQDVSRLQARNQELADINAYLKVCSYLFIAARSVR